MEFICLSCKALSERADYESIVDAKGLCVICETLGDKAYNKDKEREKAARNYQSVETMRRTRVNKNKKVKPNKFRYVCTTCSWSSGRRHKQPIACPNCNATDFNKM